MGKDLPPEIAKLAKRAVRLAKSGEPIARVLDILARPDGDISTVVNRMARVDNDELRRGFAALARLVRELEKHAGTAVADRSKIALPATREVFPTDQPTTARTVDRVKLFIDGASRGNPGPAAIGLVFTDMDGAVLWQVSRLLDQEATSNVAEYEALREGIARALGQGWKKLHVFSDSELLVRQMLGQYKIKNPVLQKQAAAVRRLISRLDAFTIAHVGRRENYLADRLAAHALKDADK